MTRLQQAHARHAKARAIEEETEAFVEGYIERTGEPPSLVITTMLRYAFAALVVQTDLERAGQIAHEVFEALCTEHKLHGPTDRSLTALGSRVASTVKHDRVRLSTILPVPTWDISTK